VKEFLEILTNVRIGAVELGGMLSLLFLIAYSLWKAWQDFIAKPLKKAARRNRLRIFPPQDCP
jgi:hypothetical protein